MTRTTTPVGALAAAVVAADGLLAGLYIHDGGRSPWLLTAAAIALAGGLLVVAAAAYRRPAGGRR